jgi:hypothetical protein
MSHQRTWEELLAPLTKEEAELLADEWTKADLEALEEGQREYQMELAATFPSPVSRTRCT